MMDHSRPVHCMKDTAGEMWRIQCDHATKVCLYAASEELTAGGERGKPLERVRDCDPQGIARAERDLTLDAA